MRQIVSFTNEEVIQALLEKGVNLGKINCTTIHDSMAQFSHDHTVLTFNEGPKPQPEVPAVVSVQPPAKKQNKDLTLWGTELPLATIWTMLAIQKIQLAMNKVKRIAAFMWHRIFEETE